MPSTYPPADNEIIDVSIVIVSFNTIDVTRECLAHVRKHAAAVRHEVLVVDNASVDGSGDMVAAEFPEARLIRSDENRPFWPEALWKRPFNTWMIIRISACWGAS